MALSALLAASCHAPAATSTPAATSADRPVHLVFHQRRPGEVATVTAQARFLGRTWSSLARYRVPASGSLDLDRVAPLSGSYSGVDGMGLFWSLAAAGPPPSVADVAQPERVTIKVGGAGPAVRLALTRPLGPSGGTERQLRPGPGQPLYADYLRPPGAGTRPGVVIVGGAEGGLDTGLPVAEALAGRGLAVLDLAYFAEPGLPARLAGLPIEYFATALRWLGRQPGVDPTRLYLYGVSRGTEAVLLTASYYPGLEAGVVALDPSDSVLCGLSDCSTSGWSYRGRPLPYTRQVSDPRPSDVPASLIPIGRFPGQVLLACGGADSRWDSCAYSRAISDELAGADRPQAELLDYPAAGHGIGFALPYLPQLEGPGLAGSSPAANPEARAAEWPRIVSFLGGPSDEYRTVVLDGHPVVCAAVFRTDAQHRRGLSGPSAPVAGAFLNSPASQPSLWMRNVRRDLEAVWVGPGGAVLGTVAMKAQTTDLHPAPSPVPLILELPPSLWQHWSQATRAALAGPCHP